MVIVCAIAQDCLYGTFYWLKHQCRFSLVLGFFLSKNISRRKDYFLEQKVFFFFFFLEGGDHRDANYVEGLKKKKEAAE
jgi:hypothetical protein